MKRVLSLAVLVVAACAVPATAYEPIKLGNVVTYRVDDNGAGVGTGIPGQPLFGARWDKATGEVCVGFSYQVPQCVGGPIE